MLEITRINYLIDEYILLPNPSPNPQLPFFEIINNRKSKRFFSKIDLQLLSNLLWWGAKAKILNVSNEGQIISHRTSPSAGAIHPIDIFISLPKNLKERDLLYYNPFTHKLGKLQLRKSILYNFFSDINNCLDCTNATILWFGSSFARTEFKYKNPESLIWRDAGALLMTIQLIATALNLNSCPLGTLGNPYFSNLFKKEDRIISAGGILIG